MLYLPIIAAIISAFGQVLLKSAMLKNGPIIFSVKGLISLFSQPQLIFAFCIYILAMVMWLQVLSKVPLSTAYPILSLTYILIPVLSMVFFNERINANQFIGMFLILAGVAFIGKGV